MMTMMMINYEFMIKALTVRKTEKAWSQRMERLIDDTSSVNELSITNDAACTERID